MSDKPMTEEGTELPDVGISLTFSNSTMERGQQTVSNPDRSQPTHVRRARSRSDPVTTSKVNRWPTIMGMARSASSRLDSFPPSSLQHPRVLDAETGHMSEAGSRRLSASTNSWQEIPGLPSKKTSQPEIFNGYLLDPLPSLHGLQTLPTAHATPEYRTPPEISPQTSWERTKQLRTRTINLRAQIQGQRYLVQVKASAKAEADEAYIKFIRERHAIKENSTQIANNDRKFLEKLWRDCQIVRDEYGPLEADLFKMEDRLDDEEHKLVRAEEQLFEQINLLQKGLPMSSEVPPLDDESNSDSSSAISEEEIMTLHDEYLLRLGDEDIMHERRDELLYEKEWLEGERERRKAVGMLLDSPELDFLLNFDTIIEPLIRELQEVSEDVVRLMQRCIDDGCLEEHEERSGSNVEEAQFKNNSPESSMSPLERWASEDNQDAHRNLIQRLTVADDEHKGYPGLVNTWLLNVLRSSVVQITLLSVAVRKELDDINHGIWRVDVQLWFNGKQWQIDALRSWYQDGTTMIPTNRNPSLHPESSTDLISQKHESVDGQNLAEFATEGPRPGLTLHSKQVSKPAFLAEPQVLMYRSTIWVSRSLPSNHGRFEISTSGYLSH